MARQRSLDLGANARVMATPENRGGFSADCLDRVWPCRLPKFNWIALGIVQPGKAAGRVLLWVHLYRDTRHPGCAAIVSTFRTIQACLGSPK